MSDSDDDDSLLLANEIEEMLETLPEYPNKCCIFKVPVNLRSVNDTAYTPRVISIGPLHHGNTKLQAMEVYKKRYLIRILKCNTNKTIVDYVRSLKGIEERVRKTYNAEQFPNSLSSNEFVTMMLLDGCFIVVLFISFQYWRHAMTYDPHMYATRYHDSNVKFDMLLLENQLPFFLLQHLFNFISGGDEQCNKVWFLELTLNYFARHVKMGQVDISRLSGIVVYHFVDLLLKCYVPTKPIVSSEDRRVTIHLPSATELHELGIKFKKTNNTNFLDISFTEGMLKIPPLLVTISTDTKFRNMIAMEQCHPGTTTSYISDYMMLMDYHINTANDVSLLRSCGIVESFLGSDEKVCELFNDMTKGVFRGTMKSQYYEVIQGTNAYCNSHWNRCWAPFRKKYFNNPWTFLSLIAALVLLVCTVAQTVFSTVGFT